MCTLLLKAAKLNFCLLSGSFETGTDGRACSEGNKQIPGGSGRETWNVYAALKQETENIHHVQHPSYRGEIPAALHASQDLSKARDSCSLKGRSSHHVALRCTKVALSRPGPFSLRSACVDSACPKLNSVPSGRFHISCTGRIVLEPSRFPVFPALRERLGYGVDCAAAVIVVSAIYNPRRGTFFTGVG